MYKRQGMFSITSSPTNKEYQEFSIKKCGQLTDYLHSLEVGDEITAVSYTHLDATIDIHFLRSFNYRISGEYVYTCLLYTSRCV